MHRKLVIIGQIFVLSACTINNLHYNLNELAAGSLPQSFHRDEAPQVLPADKSVTPAPLLPKVASVPTDCRRVPFPDLKPMPEPPIKEIEAIDPKDRKRINEVMLAYTEQLRQTSKDTRAKYLAAKSQYLRRCLQ